MSLDRRAQELRRGERFVRHHLGRDQRGLRDLSRTGLGACRLGSCPSRLAALERGRRLQGPDRQFRRAQERRLDDRSRDRQCDAQRDAGDFAQGSRNVRLLSRAPRDNRGRLGFRTMAVRYACRVAAERRPLFRRRANGGRGLQLRLFQAEQDVRQGRHLQRLSRSAQRQAQVARRRRLPAMPRGGQIRRRGPQPARGCEPPSGLPGLPHADPHLYGRRSAPRSLLAHSPAGPHRRARHAERLQRLPRRQDGPVGGRRRAKLAWSDPQGVPALRSSVPRRLERRRRRRGAARGHSL